jgi:lipoprotein-anchoring transpeptidase ErfK/SrfK
VTALGAAIAVDVTPAGGRLAELANPRPSGAPLTFLLDRREGAWLKVFLPTRPNGSEGWVSAADVTVTGVPYRLDVHVDAHRLDLFAYGQLLRSFVIGVGRAQTPTPGGVFYLVELLRPPDPGGAYGPYAYGLSGHSTTLASFAGADAVIGLHGTNEPAALGHDVSHGCIRLANPDITYLAGLLPLGTPVRILH